MTVNYRALFVWFQLFTFLILFVIRLDDKLVCSWFLVFIPMWVLDFIISAYIVFYISKHCMSGVDQANRSQYRKACYLVCVLLKLAFQVLQVATYTNIINKILLGFFSFFFLLELL